MSGSVTVLAAFLGGVVSFLSPCVLPLIPGYLSFITGMSASDLASEERPTSRVLTQSLLFVAGFTTVFVALGASASALGSILVSYRTIVEVVAGIAVMIFGVFMTGIVRIPWMSGEFRMDLARSRTFGQAASFVMGMAFAAGWTPCVGPILGSILMLAGSAGSVSQGAGLLAVYSLGLGVPFVAVALLFGSVRPLLSWLMRHSEWINRVAGGLLIVIGALIATGRLSVVVSFLTRLVPFSTG